MDLKKDRRNTTVAIAVGSCRLVQRLLSGGESQQTRKGACLVPQGIEACKKGRSMPILIVIKEHCFTLNQDLRHTKTTLHRFRSASLRAKRTAQKPNVPQKYLVIASFFPKEPMNFSKLIFLEVFAPLHFLNNFRKFFVILPVFMVF
jgi:hypothetical protein